MNLERPASRLLTLTTDFGYGSYVAQMKGVIHSLLPGAEIVDVAHDVEPGDVLAAAYVLETVVPAFPEDTVHVVVVDPGVGTERRAIAARYAGRLLVGPDNGVFSAFLAAAEEVRVLSNEGLFLPEVSATFHGRDVFAPVAALLAGGLGIEEVGPLLTEPAVILAELHAEGDEGRVLYVDRFGNLVTSFPAEVLAARPAAWLCGPDGEVRARARTFGEAPAGLPFLYAGSGGRLEVAVPGDSAARELGWGSGTALTLAEEA